MEALTPSSQAPGGLSFCGKALDYGAPLHDVAHGFVNVAEFKAVHGAAPTHGENVSRFHQNVQGGPAMR
ncbi:hypothetical protein ABEG18_06760 [Alsobacter sp. KACC 23698]|uniref:Uncharacterized protein n=1 Tax=Alsobacter sp. KACC 23698 TaxID=3149229 RepID=A0AAU7JJA5_9HYPH